MPVWRKKVLKIKNIRKDYLSGDSKVEALKGINIEFRRNEFVSVLGPSGCGKTTLLNIIGGLDHYTYGDLSINGVSTKKFSDSDWDTYRNHSVGFVFQSYNLISHQTVLSNVELALTLSGVSKSERRKRAIDALTKVGLGDQLKKKPNQMSGGQMQRVAIARALVNDPEILLADEPTGALDTQTSIQIMEILREISKDKLIIMVTHNPELAEKYSSRIISLIDGKVVGDTNPYNSEKDGDMPSVTADDKKSVKVKRKKKPSMSFFTALSLSMNNLMTKKGRTFLTSFAGSIGIIGIALILSLSSGIQIYINRVQEDALSSYPLTIESQTMDYSAMLTSLMGQSASNVEEHETGYIYSSDNITNLLQSLMAGIAKNDLGAFKDYIESSGDFDDYITAIRYTYDINPSVYTKTDNGTLKVNPSIVYEKMYSLMGVPSSSQSSSSLSSSLMGMSGLNIWEEMLDNSDLLKSQYDLIAGEWTTNDTPTKVMLVVDNDYEISDLTAFALGIKDYNEFEKLIYQFIGGEAETETAEKDTVKLSYDYILNNMKFYLIYNSSYFVENADGTWTDMSKDEAFVDSLIDQIIAGDTSKGLVITVGGIIMPNESATSTSISGAIAYPSSLTKTLMSAVNSSDVVKAQENNTDTDILTGLPFDRGQYDNLSDTEKAKFIGEYLKSLSDEKKAEIMKDILADTPEENMNLLVDNMLNGLDKDGKINLILLSAQNSDSVRKALIVAVLRQSVASLPEEYRSTFDAMTDDELIQIMEQQGVSFDFDTSELTEEEIAQINATVSSLDDNTLDSLSRAAAEYYIRENLAKVVEEQYGSLPDSELAAMLDDHIDGLEASQDDDTLADYYDRYAPQRVSKSTLSANYLLMGRTDSNSVASISLYAKDFASKDEIKRLIDNYDGDDIVYSDYVGIMLSSVTMIINAISYVLIAFVSISLIVSSIMIGIITYISVLERTKEIGILRAIGASKKDISRVFNAETLIVGFAAGMIGILITLILCIPINIIIYTLSGVPGISATLPVLGGVILVLISMFLTFIAGLIPAKVAARKDPVVALRSE